MDTLSENHDILFEGKVGWTDKGKEGRMRIPVGTTHLLEENRSGLV